MLAPTALVAAPVLQWLEPAAAPQAGREHVDLVPRLGVTRPLGEHREHDAVPADLVGDTRQPEHVVERPGLAADVPAGVPCGAGEAAVFGERAGPPRDREAPIHWLEAVAWLATARMSVVSVAAGTRLSPLSPEPSTRRSPLVGTPTCRGAPSSCRPGSRRTSDRRPSAIATWRARTSASVSSEWVSSVPTSSDTVADRTDPSVVRRLRHGVTDAVSTRTSGPEQRREGRRRP